MFKETSLDFLVFSGVVIISWFLFCSWFLGVGVLFKFILVDDILGLRKFSKMLLFLGGYWFTWGVDFVFFFVDFLLGVGFFFFSSFSSNFDFAWLNFERKIDWLLLFMVILWLGGGGGGVGPGDISGLSAGICCTSGAVLLFLVKYFNISFGVVVRIFLGVDFCSI